MKPQLTTREMAGELNKALEQLRQLADPAGTVQMSMEQFLLHLQLRIGSGTVYKYLQQLGHIRCIKRGGRGRLSDWVIQMDGTITPSELDRCNLRLRTRQRGG